MSRIFAEIGDETYIVESRTLWGIKKKEKMASDIDPCHHSQWLEWNKAQEGSTSINDERVVEYKTKQVRKSFGLFGKRPLSDTEPEGWTREMSRFVKGSPDSETLLSLVVRFEKRFPQMTNRVGQGFFEIVRGDILSVPSHNDRLWL